MMGNEIEIKIHQDHILYDVLGALGLIAFISCIIYMMINFFSPFSPTLLILTLLSGALTGLSFYLIGRPTTVWSDGERLCWKHIFREHRIYLAEITDIFCEPYESYSRYGAYQRIRLTLHTDSEPGEINFTDSVDAGDLIDEKLGKTKTEIPLMQLNDYLRERCKKQ
jgi:hypothetical protein